MDCVTVLALPVELEHSGVYEGSIIVRLFHLIRRRLANPITLRMIVEVDTIFLIQPLDIRKCLGNGTKRLKATVQCRPSEQMNFKLVAPLFLRLMHFEMLTPHS